MIVWKILREPLSEILATVMSGISVEHEIRDDMVSKYTTTVLVKIKNNTSEWRSIEIKPDFSYSGSFKSKTANLGPYDLSPNEQVTKKCGITMRDDGELKSVSFEINEV